MSFFYEPFVDYISLKNKKIDVKQLLFTSPTYVWIFLQKIFKPDN